VPQVRRADHHPATAERLSPAVKLVGWHNDKAGEAVGEPTTAYLLLGAFGLDLFPGRRTGYLRGLCQAGGKGLMNRRDLSTVSSYPRPA